MNIKKPELKNEFAILNGQGLGYREIAKKLNVSTSTLARWRNELEPHQLELIKKGLLKRFLKMSKNCKTPVNEILAISTALAALEHVIDKTIKKNHKNETN